MGCARCVNNEEISLILVWVINFVDIADMSVVCVLHAPEGLINLSLWTNPEDWH